MLGSFDRPADDSYAEINAKALSDYQNWFQTKLYDLGVTHWDKQFDCDNVANLYADLLQLKFYLSNWSSDAPPKGADSPAVASFWYRPNCGDLSHAINAIGTNEGLIFIEPQTGQRLNLTPNELASQLRSIF